MSSNSCLLMASPSPVPPYLRVVEASAWEKDSKRRPRCSSVIPIRVPYLEAHHRRALPSLRPA
jgi:hypothetical protein